MSMNQRITSSTANLYLVKYILIIILLLSLLENASSAIQCYKCAVVAEKHQIRNNTIVTPICSKFDKSSNDYLVDCPLSTMCLKTISTLALQNGQNQDTITRGCAQQTQTTQVFRNRQWQQEHSVQEVYNEGCEVLKDNDLTGSIKTLCYCRGNLCNTAGSRFNHRITLLTVIFLINAIINSLRNLS